LRRREMRLILAGKLKPEDATQLKLLFNKDWFWLGEEAAGFFEEATGYPLSASGFFEEATGYPLQADSGQPKADSGQRTADSG
jgi:hypothetical protein